MCTIARYLVLLVVGGCIIGGALVALAGTASAVTTDVQRPSIVATPNVKAHPAPNAMPGWRWHHGIRHLQDLQPGYAR
jgi:hypothetical protein